MDEEIEKTIRQITFYGKVSIKIDSDLAIIHFMPCRACVICFIVHFVIFLTFFNTNYTQ